MFHSLLRNVALHLSSYRITEKVSVKAQLDLGLSESGALLGQVCLLVLGFYWGLSFKAATPLVGLIPEMPGPP